MQARNPAAASKQSEPPDTADLIRRAAAGERAAFSEIVARYHTTVFRWAAVVLGDADEADDVAQVVLLKVHASLASYRGGARFTTWLYRITSNVLFEVNRKTQRRGNILSRADDFVEKENENENEETIDGRRFAKLVREYMSDLPPRQREVFVLADMEGFAPAEIAELLGVEAVTVRTNLLKARRAIRSRMLREQPKLMEEYKS